MLKITYISVLFLFTHSTILFAQNPLPTEESTLFSGSGNCVLCHSSDGIAMTWMNIDVSPISYWRSSMMGNASKDPFWRAIVAEEIHQFPQLQSTIETTCLRCHSPMGYTEAFYNGDTTYLMAQLKSDPLANDGVSCTACHQLKPNNFGSEGSYSGHYIIEDDRIIYGPYDNSDTTHMPVFVNYTVEYGPHMNQAELCATCHTLFTPFIDNTGNVGGYFPEQTPYIEWKNSIYPAQNTKCQDCHMPLINDPILISSNGNYSPRTPFWRHNFVGGNVYMLKMLRDNIDSVGATAEPEHFDSTIARAEYNLTEKALQLTTTSGYENDSIIVNVKIENKAGHKLPTGIPFRRMWVHLIVEEVGGPVVFESGEWDITGKILDYNSDFEPHYLTINSEDEVQVYEGVFVDVDQQITYTLLRASEYIKDNRIPPRGFISSHISYDTTGIFGNAINDPDFNKENSIEGTGADIITYKIGALPNTNYRITVEICYQPIKTEIVDKLRTINELDVNRFVNMYDGLPNVPFIMKSETFDIVTGINHEPGYVSEYKLHQNYPNPFNPSTTIKFTVVNNGIVTLKIYDILGKEVATLVNKEMQNGNYSVDFDASDLTSGIYYYRLDAGDFSETKKMILLK